MSIPAIRIPSGGWRSTERTGTCCKIHRENGEHNRKYAILGWGQIVCQTSQFMAIYGTHRKSDYQNDQKKPKNSTAGIAQLVEHNLAKVGVASSSLVSRSKFLLSQMPLVLFAGTHKRRSPEGLGGRVVMQRPAKPWTPVRFRPQPPFHYGRVHATA